MEGVEESEGADEIDSTVAAGAASEDDSIVDLAQQPIVVDWVKFVTALFTVVAIGIGLFLILSDAVGESIFEIEGFDLIGTGDVGGAMVTAVGEVYTAIVASAFVGAFLGWRLNRDDTTTFLAGGLSAFAATAALLVVTAIFAAIALDGISLDIGGLLVNAILAGLAAAIAAVGGVWVVRNLAPSTIEDSASAGGPAPAAPSDD